MVNAKVYVRNTSIHGIWVMVDTDRTIVTKASQNLQAAMDKISFGGGSEVTRQVVHVANSEGFTKMLPGVKVGFYIGANPDWVTIYYQERMVDGPIGPPVLVCSAFPTDGSRDVWVQKDNTIWTDYV